MFNTFVKQTEVNSGGGIRISVYKQTFDPNGNLVAEQPHQITITPFDDFDYIIEMNNAHLESMGYPSIDPDELTLPLQLRATALGHAKVIERVEIERARRAAQAAQDEADRQRAIDLAAQQAEAAQTVIDEAVLAAMARLGALTPIKANN